MNRPPEVDARLVAWLDEAATTGPEDLLLSVFERTRVSRQDRVWLDPLARRMRFRSMHTILKAALVAVAVMAIGVGGLWTRTSHQAAVGGPSPSPTATPAPLRPGMTLPAGDYTVAPFGGAEWAPCGAPPAECTESAVDDAIRFTFTVPDGWAGAPGGNDIWLAGANNSGPEGAGLLFGRGGPLYSDPCSDAAEGDISVGPTVDDFVNALVAHPMLDVTEPVDVTIGGYSGKYVELQGPADRTHCVHPQAWSPTFYAQGDSDHQPIWVLDVNGVRVVIHGSEFPDTPPERSAELRAIVDSLRIEAPTPLQAGMTLPAGDYTVAPFGGTEWAPCGPPAQDACTQASVDDAVRLTFTVPDGWAAAPFGNDLWLAGANNSGPEGAGLLFGRGGWLYSDPCATNVEASIPVGPTVDDFVDALMANPKLEVTDPVDVTIGGHAGKYLELQGPADRTSCQYFQAWDPTFYAQGDSNHQPIWALDANGVRVVIHGSEFPGTPPERAAELRAIVESLRIDP